MVRTRSGGRKFIFHSRGGCVSFCGRLASPARNFSSRGGNFGVLCELGLVKSKTNRRKYDDKCFSRWFLALLSCSLGFSFMYDFSRFAEELEAARVLSLNPLFHPLSPCLGASKGYCRQREPCERP